jgi:hypothetical protein
MSLEVLHRALVLFGCRARFEGAQISAPFGFRVEFARVQPIFVRSEFAYHSFKSSKCRARHGIPANLTQWAGSKICCKRCRWTSMAAL